MKDGMMKAVEPREPEKGRKLRWWWPLGVFATSIAGLAVVALRGCWHRKMSWPVRAQAHSYQVCLACGAKRLFDEKNFRAYGPFRYNLNELIAWQRSKRSKPDSEPNIQRPAS
jgi:hypothetical protein